MVAEFSAFRSAVAFSRPELGVILASADGPADTLLLFIHGYIGDYYSTWGNTPLFMMDDENFRTADLCFLGYRAPVAGCSSLGGYIASVLRRAARGAAPFPVVYQKLIVVAHSLGGLGVRAAVLDLVKGLDTDVVKKLAEILLAAPPLFGFHQSRIRVLGTAIDLLSVHTPVVLDVVNRSQELKLLRDGYDDAMRDRASQERPRSHVKWALYDRIAIRPEAGYAPPPPDTQDFWPYSHSAMVKPDRPGHHFYATLLALMSMARS